MNKPFLEKLATQIAGEFGASMSETCVVLPNRRSGLFFKRYLGKKTGKNIIAPLILSIEDFMFNASGLLKADTLVQTLELYRAYRETTPGEPKTLEQFLGMGKSILNDFNEIDLYMVDADAIFNHLSDIKAMSLWNPENTPLTDFQQNYLGFYRSQAKLYHRFNERLSEQKIAYEGKAYRAALENYHRFLEVNNVGKVIFAGLNALSKAEEEIITVLIKEGIAQIYWDADNYYLNSPDHEAGRFIQKYLRSWSSGNRNWITDSLSSDEKQIQISGIPGNITQVKYAGQILAELTKSTEKLDNTAVVLADEKLLVPLLHSIPEEIREMNITMGYPLKYTPAYSFLKSAMMLHENPDGSPRTAFYAPEIIKLARHPYFRYLFRPDKDNNNTSVLDNGIESLRNSNKLTYKVEEAHSLFLSGNKVTDGAVVELFSAWESPGGQLDALTGLINSLKSIFIGDNRKERKLEVEYLFYFARIINRLKDLLGTHSEIDNIKLTRKLVLQAAEATSIPFYGEPLKGLQIMGMLETRAIDFENLIILSVNENVIPSGKTYNSFIPHEIKKHYGIPTYTDKDAVYAYHFYRLLQRSSNVNVIYNTEQDEMGKGEKSRFVTQLMLELPQKNLHSDLSESIISIPPGTEKPDTSISIEKTGTILSLVREKAQKGFSPSSLNTYINCSLQFYFNYIAGLKEEEELEDTIQSQTLGDVVHHALKVFYERFKNNYVTKEGLKPGNSVIEDIISISFNEKYEGGSINEGLNLLIYKLAGAYFRNYLRHESKTLEDNPGLTIEIKKLEDDLKFTLNTDPDLIKTTVNIGGKVDRVDTRNGRFQVIDYKTGAVDPENVKVKQIEELFTNPGNSYPFQLMTYAWALSRMENIPAENIDAGIFSLRKPSNGIMQVNIPGGLSGGVLEEFESGLKKLVEEIFDTSIPFSQAEDIDRCKWCPYKEICIRI